MIFKEDDISFTLGFLLKKTRKIQLVGKDSSSRKNSKVLNFFFDFKLILFHYIDIIRATLENNNVDGYKNLLLSEGIESEKFLKLIINFVLNCSVLELSQLDILFLNFLDNMIVYFFYLEKEIEKAIINKGEKVFNEDGTKVQKTIYTQLKGLNIKKIITIIEVIGKSTEVLGENSTTLIIEKS